MKNVKYLSMLALGLFSPVVAVPAGSQTARQLPSKVTVTASGATVTGKVASSVESFQGIPYAYAPSGQLRLKPPQKRLFSTLGNFDATVDPATCPQGPFISGTLQKRLSFAEDLGLNNVQVAKPSEDCLSITIQRPAGTKSTDKLPVLFWIYGGGFLFVSASAFDATDFINTGKKTNQGFIFVSVNYRLAGWGFLPGAEVLRDGSGNLGLLDQRLGLQWVADNIASFGGDPDKVTIWGQSAGAISVFDHLIMYDGNAKYNDKPLFRAAIMNSGSATPTDPLDCPKAQDVYDRVVKSANCTTANDTLQCLRSLDAPKFQSAVNSLGGIISVQSLALSYLPRPDGKVITTSPEVLAKDGKFHAVPMIIGNQEDEGTLFAQTQKDMGTTAKIVDYFAKYYFHAANRNQITQFVDTYSTNRDDGSPFRAAGGIEGYPGKKRLAAILGDIVFTLTRRVSLNLLTKARPNLPMWSYLSSYYYLPGALSFLGTHHGSDINVLFRGSNDDHATASGRAYYINFLHNLDPNLGNTVFSNWPKYTEGKQLMWFNKSNNGLLPDTFRNASYTFMEQNSEIMRF